MLSVSFWSLIWICHYIPIKRTILLFDHELLNNLLSQATNQAVVGHLVYYHTPNNQWTDCHHEYFHWNVNDDLRWKCRHSRRVFWKRVLHVSRHGKRHCITSRSIYCRFTWSICVAMVIVYWYEGEEEKI